jgi:LTXXQ motif family protein
LTRELSRQETRIGAPSPQPTAKQTLASKPQRNDAVEDLAQSIRDRDRFFARHGFGRGFVGWAGPMFWPYGYQDLFNYTFWPSYGEYYDPFWAYGYDELFAGVFWPDNADRGIAGGVNRRGYRGGRAAMRSGMTEKPDLCGPENGVLLTFDRIKKAVQPTGNASLMLGALQRVATSAATAVKDACPSRIASTPMARLEVVVRRLAALLEAAEMVRGALERFYQALDASQQARLDHLSSQTNSGSGSSSNSSSSNSSSSSSSSNSNSSNSNSNRSNDDGEVQKISPGPARICGQHTALIAQFTIDQIASAVRPTGVQKTHLDELRAASARAAEKITASCPAEPPETVTGRLDAVLIRLAGLREAVITVAPGLARLYESLEEEQRARFEQLRWQE